MSSYKLGIMEVKQDQDWVLFFKNILVSREYSTPPSSIRICIMTHWVILNVNLTFSHPIVVQGPTSSIFDQFVVAIRHVV